MVFLLYLHTPKIRLQFKRRVKGEEFETKIENDCTEGKYSGSDEDNSPFQSFCQIVDGKWGEWSEWESCDKCCGGGSQRRFRTCDNPPPGPNGKKCEGERIDTRKCNTYPCPGLIFQFLLFTLYIDFLASFPRVSTTK